MNVNLIVLICVHQEALDCGLRWLGYAVAGIYLAVLWWGSPAVSTRSCNRPSAARQAIPGARVRVLAITFDFYNTLVYHRKGIGRGRQYQEYLSAAGFASDPWERQVLYDVFEYYGACYSPMLGDDAKLSFWTEFTRRLFERTNVRAPDAVNHPEHARAIRDIMGPNCFAVFDDSLETLSELKNAGLRLGVISDWQKGLTHFCDELGLGTYLDVVVASGEVGYRKPDPRLFEVALDRMNVPAHEILHVGDRPEDVLGAKGAGFSAVLLVRGRGPAPAEVPLITNLRDVLLSFKLVPNPEGIKPQGSDPERV